jgi:thymidylate kinase
MIFVNTSLDTAQERNLQRKRTLPEKQVAQMWNDVQRNIGKFQSLFGSQDFIIVDNNDPAEDIFIEVWKRLTKMVKRKVTNNIAKQWIQQELDKKKR